MPVSCFPWYSLLVRCARRCATTGRRRWPWRECSRGQTEGASAQPAWSLRTARLPVRCDDLSRAFPTEMSEHCLDVEPAVALPAFFAQAMVQVVPRLRRRWLTPGGLLALEETPTLAGGRRAGDAISGAVEAIMARSRALSSRGREPCLACVLLALCGGGSCSRFVTRQTGCLVPTRPCRRSRVLPRPLRGAGALRGRRSA
jgi:hypothetical protein